MQITLSQLESHLWESANILRGPVDASDFKTYIFPLLFFKRICDVWGRGVPRDRGRDRRRVVGLISGVAPLPDPGRLPLERRSNQGQQCRCDPAACDA